MNFERTIRINKVLRELNISLDRAIAVLDTGNFEIECSPNAKINQIEYEYLKYRLNHPPTVVKEINTINNQFKLTENRDKLGSATSVFKYFGVQDYNIEGFKKSYLYYSNYSNFNDPFDCNIELITFDKARKRTRHKRKEEILKENFKNLGVCCFSRNVNSILMWAHYASNHRGFCLEFYSNRSLDGINPLDVIYSNNFIKAAYYNNQKDALFHLIYTKAKDWEYEKELRSIQINLLNDEARKIAYKKEELKSIYLGVNIESNIKQQLLDIVDKVYNKRVEVYQGVLSSLNFEINWERVSL
jgi:hypothetical protein